MDKLQNNPPAPNPPVGPYSPEGPQGPGQNPPPPGKQDGDSPQNKNNQVKSLKELGINQPPSPFHSDIHSIPIVGQIEGHIVLSPKNKTTKYEHIIPQLIAVEENPKVKGLLVVLNTVGGDIEAGLAISEMINSMDKATVSIVLGGGHSIGVPIAVATDYSFIVPSASMTVHPIRLTGMVIGVPQTYEYLDKMQDRVISFVTDHSRITAEEFRNLMFQTGELVRDVGTVLIGDECVNSGIIDEVGGLSTALNKLRMLINSKEDVIE